MLPPVAANKGVRVGACGCGDGRASYLTVRQLIAMADGAQIDVFVDGEADGAALVLLPSSQRDSTDFDVLAQGLAHQGFRVLRPQPRGMCRSSAPPAGMTLHTLAADVAQTIEQLGGGRAIVAGHAYGHYVARVTDLDHPQRVRGVVVLAGAAQDIPPGLQQALDTAADATRAQAERLASLRLAFFAPGNDPRAWLEGWHPQWRDHYRRAAATPPRSTWWPVSHAPILDLQAAQDPWRPHHSAQELKAVLGDRVTVRVIAGASHALVPEQPAAVVAAIAEWVHLQLPAL